MKDEIKQDILTCRAYAPTREILGCVYSRSFVATLSGLTSLVSGGVLNNVVKLTDDGSLVQALHIETQLPLIFEHLTDIGNERVYVCWVKCYSKTVK